MKNKEIYFFIFDELAEFFFVRLAINFQKRKAAGTLFFLSLLGSVFFSVVMALFF